MSSAISSFLYKAIEMYNSAIVFCFGGWLAMNGTLTAGQLLAFSLHWKSVSSAARQFSSSWESLVMAKAAAERVYAVYDFVPDRVGSSLSPSSLKSIAGCPIEFDNVTFAYETRPDNV